MTASAKTIFVCTKCDAQFPKWSGRCLECGSWSTLKEIDASLNDEKKKEKIKFDDSLLIDFQKIEKASSERIKTNIKEIDNVLGGGIAQGSLILLGGEPGIGKSTLVMQLADRLTRSSAPIIYSSGEESAQQIKMRLDRLSIRPDKIKYLGQTKVETIAAAMESIRPPLCIVDSIQTVYSSDLESEPGNVSQVRACAVKLLEAAKKSNVPVIIIGHITKDGQVAGPKTLEHLVDVVLYLEGDKFRQFRILRSVKNRFGSTNEIGIFDMQSKGLLEVNNPSEYFMTEAEQNFPGRVTTCIIEGSRAFLIEVQALVSKTVFGYPQRKTSGFDLNRLQLLAAVINKRTDLNLISQDIHLNITSGLKVQDPGIDLAVILAIASSAKNIEIPATMIALGEVGLGGEIRPVSQTDRRLKEAENLGYKQAVLPQCKAKSAMELISGGNISEIIGKILKK